MKNSVLTAILLLAGMQIVTAQDAPQRRTRVRPSEAAAEAAAPTVSNLTERAKIKNETESKKPSHVAWERVIYRSVDLTKQENNAALYYPVQPLEGRQNLFTLIFKLLADGKIPAYTYQEGGEVFTKEQQVNFEDVLKKYQLLYTKNGERYVVDDRDIPSQDVTQYIVKEAYIFDQATGMFRTQVLAICPVLVREDFYYGGTSREALFWLNYDDIRPYLSRELMMTSNYNNALRYTMDDYFRTTMYTGDIIKTLNMMGKSLQEQVGNDPDSLKTAQDSIERQLKAFEQQLWVYNDSTFAEQPQKGGKAVKQKSGRGASNAPAKQKAAKPKAEKAAKPAAAPTRSVRRR